MIGGLAFRSLTMGLLFAIPSALTICANYAFLGLAGIHLSPGAAVIACVAVGIGVDYIIYLSFRVREKLKAGFDFEAAVRQAHASAGGTAVCVATAVAVGYAVLLFSFGFHVHQWIAQIVPVTVIASLFGALFLLPFLLRILRPKLL